MVGTAGIKHVAVHERSSEVAVIGQSRPTAGGGRRGSRGGAHSPSKKTMLSLQKAGDRLPSGNRRQGAREED